VLERLEGAQDGDRWLDAKQAADYLGHGLGASFGGKADGKPNPVRTWVRMAAA
jgi:hypothetical protein